MKRSDVLVFGDLCANDITLAEFLARRGLRVCVARYAKTDSEGVKIPKDFLRALPEKDIVMISSPAELVSLARRARLVVSFTGSFGFAMKWRWPLRRLFGLPPVISIATGSDFSELLVEPSGRGRFFRYFSSTCDLNMVCAYPHVLKNILELRLKNVIFPRYPIYILPDRPVQPIASLLEGKLRFFHPSHLDFKVRDPGGHRTSAKGSDRFLRAFIRALDHGLNADCLVLDRGPDRWEAKKIVEATPHASRFVWRPHLSRDELFDEMTRADVIVDQFDVGGLGGIAIEAMALGKPVMTYVAPQCVHIVYSSPPPVISAHSEDEIFDAIMSYADRSRLLALGASAHEWVHENHGWETCLDQLLFYYSLLTGHQIVNYVSNDV